jgi:hypothetical protein
MSSRHKLQDATGIQLSHPLYGAVMATGITVPANGAGGYAPGCIFLDLDAAGGLQMWINEGSITSALFVSMPSSASGIFSNISASKETDAPGASTVAAGTTTSDAGVLPAATAKVYPTTGANGTTGVRVNAADQVTGRLLFIGNGAQAVLKVYPASGGTIAGAAADAAVSSVSGKGVVMYCLSAGSNTWLAW